MQCCESRMGAKGPRSFSVIFVLNIVLILVLLFFYLTHVWKMWIYCKVCYRVHLYLKTLARWIDRCCIHCLVLKNDIYFFPMQTRPLEHFFFRLIERKLKHYLIRNNQNSNNSAKVTFYLSLTTFKTFNCTLLVY